MFTSRHNMVEESNVRESDDSSAQYEYNIERRIVLHNEMQIRLGVKILKPEKVTYNESHGHFSDVAQIHQFLTGNGQIQSLIKSAQSETDCKTCLINNELSVFTETQNDQMMQKITCSLLHPFSFIWYVVLKLKLGQFDITYAPRAIQIVASRSNQTDTMQHSSPVYPIANSILPQYFPITWSPCCRFAHIYLSGARQRNPLTSQFQILIEKLDIKGVQLNWLALELMRARQSSRMSLRLTRTSVLENSRQNMKPNDCAQSCCKYVYEPKKKEDKSEDFDPQVVYTVSGISTFQQAAETIELIAKQHAARGRKEIQHLKCDGIGMISKRAKWNDKWGE
ncbi:Conserved_hypothetical protein [Hexamita inflata]|uniref:Uncharacterized protein n=1 Tax=Hexamita inflata TaxID=28002 RepID=A0ABP1GDT2_9EUKA